MSKVQPLRQVVYDDRWGIKFQEQEGSLSVIKGIRKVLK